MTFPGKIAASIFAALVFAPAVAVAQDAGMDAAMDASFDASADAASDASVDAADDLGVDAANDAGVDMAVSDVASDMPFADAGASYRFRGTVTLQGRTTFRDVLILLDDENSGLRFEQFTDGEGGFSFDEVPTGTYTVSVMHPEYENIVESVAIDRDIARDYRLFIDQFVDVVVVVEFAGEPSSEVELVVESERGREVETVPVEDAAARRESELGVAVWQVTAEADGYVRGTHTFEVPATETSRTAPLTITMMLHRAEEADVYVERTCSCDVSGRTASHPWWFALALAVVGGCLWRRRTA